MQKEMSLANRYAAAFINTFGLSISAIESLDTAINFFSTYSALPSLLQLSHASDQTKIDLLNQSIIDEFGLPATFQSLHRLLIHTKRAALLVPVLKQLRVLCLERHGIEEFTITSATTVSEAQRALVHTFLARHTDHAIISRMKVDPSLIAGIRMQSAHHEAEFSIARRLKHIALHLLD